MQKERTCGTGICFPCHLWEMRDAKEALHSMKTVLVREYGTRLKLDDSFALHDNYPNRDEEGERNLQRCEVCGSLLLGQHSKRECPFWDMTDEYYHDFIPVGSVEEADLLNILLSGEELREYPFRHLQQYDYNYLWTKGEEPVPNDPEELKQRIREKYAGLSPEHREMLEKMISEAGKAERS